MAVENGLIDEITRKINTLEEGDIDRLQLILLRSIHDEMKKILSNPAIVMGQFTKDYPKLSAAIFGLFLIILIVAPQILIKLLGVPTLVMP